MSDTDESAGPGTAAAMITAKPMGRFAASDLPKEILAGIGAIVAQWSYLAFQLTVILRIGFKLSKETQRAILVGTDLGAICGQMRTLAGTDHWIKDKKLRDEIDELAAEVRKKSLTRNEYAHGVFGYLVGKAGGADEEQYVRYLMKGPDQRVTPTPQEISAESLEEHLKVPLKLWQRAQELTQKLKGRLS